MRMITTENTPCFYEISWDAKTPAIILRIHKDVARFVEEEKITFNEQAPGVISFKEQFKFKSFKGDFCGNIGFDDAFVLLGGKNNFIEFLIKIPEVKKKTNKNCSECNGSGKRKDFSGEYVSGECLNCEGTGKKHIYDWQQSLAISASFSILSSLFGIFEFRKESSATFPQLLTLKTITKEGDFGGSLGGVYSMVLCEWLNSLELGPVSEIVQAMKGAYGRMVGLKKYNQFDFRANLDYQDGWLNISCPGNACGLNPTYGSIRKGEGYEFDSHNVDSPIQQITLIAGLAALHDRARKKIGSG